MLLSKSDQIKFKVLYPEYSHNKLAIIFNTNREDVIGMAKGFGIYDPNKPKDEPKTK